MKHRGPSVSTENPELVLFSMASPSKWTLTQETSEQQSLDSAFATSLRLFWKSAFAGNCSFPSPDSGKAVCFVSISLSNIFNLHFMLSFSDFNSATWAFNESNSSSLFWCCSNLSLHCTTFCCDNCTFSFMSCCKLSLADFNSGNDSSEIWWSASAGNLEAMIFWASASSCWRSSRTLL